MLPLPDADSIASDENLRCACDGDLEALSRVLSTLRPGLLRQVQLRIGPALRRRVDPEDVVQQAMLETSRRFEEWRGNRDYPFRVWVRLITRQCLAEAERRHLGTAKRDARHEMALASGPDSGVLAEWFATSATAPTEAARRAELIVGVRAAIEHLTIADREILTLRQLEGLSNEEAALELGLEPAAASKRLVRALVRLRPMLGRFLPESSS
jgi:RNA polymerase sigma-70 factor (ECF subfamily)